MLQCAAAGECTREGSHACILLLSPTVACKPRTDHVCVSSPGVLEWGVLELNIIRSMCSEIDPRERDLASTTPNNFFATSEIHCHLV